MDGVATMEQITSALQTGLTSLSGDAMGVIATIVPIAVGVAAAVFVVRKGMSWFKSLAK